MAVISERQSYFPTNVRSFNFRGENSAVTAGLSFPLGKIEQGSIVTSAYVTVKVPSGKSTATMAVGTEHDNDAFVTATQVNTKRSHGGGTLKANAFIDPDNSTSGNLVVEFPIAMTATEFAPLDVDITLYVLNPVPVSAADEDRSDR